jgi:two-component system phosphate regulon response regulator PhoB
VGRTVLVADDHRETVEFVAATLTQAGYAVVTAGSGSECLAMAKQHSPDLVVLDLSMPGMGGMETLRRLRREEMGRDLPVVVLSGRLDLGLTAAGLPVPAERYLRKPVSSAALVAAVARALERGEQQR